MSIRSTILWSSSKTEFQKCCIRWVLHCGVLQSARKSHGWGSRPCNEPRTPEHTKWSSCSHRRISSRQ
ncbi:hypothetical protein PENTCL1PPCAC_1049, partial [Pristionchus entomophagus]